MAAAHLRLPALEVQVVQLKPCADDLHELSTRAPTGDDGAVATTHERNVATGLHLKRISLERIGDAWWERVGRKHT